MINPILRKLTVEIGRVRMPLPGFPQLMSSLADDDVEFEALTAMLNRFPGIVARLLAAANSAWCQRGSPVTSLNSACSNLGLRLVRSISISVAVSAPFNALKCPAFDVTRFWSSSLLVADAAQKLAHAGRAARPLEPESVHTAGLLHNIGLLWLADQFPRDLDSAFHLAARSADTSFLEALNGVFGIGLAKVSALVLGRWGIPGPLVTAIENHADPAYEDAEWQSAALIGTSTEIVAAVSHDVQCPSARIALQALGLTQDTLADVYRHTKSQATVTAEIARSLGKR